MNWQNLSLGLVSGAEGRVGASSQMMRTNFHVEPGVGAMRAAKTRRAKTTFDRIPWGSAKERKHRSSSMENIKKMDPWAASIVKSPRAGKAPLPVLASTAARPSASGNKFGSSPN
jgi:hypothetical protein